VEAPTDADDDAVRKKVIADARIQKHLEGVQIVKTIIVRNKLVNLVVK